MNESLCPKVVREGDRIWLTIVVHGERRKHFETFAVRSQLLGKQFVEAAGR
jgi:hypothetical protein